MHVPLTRGCEYYIFSALGLFLLLLLFLSAGIEVDWLYYRLYILLLLCISAFSLTLTRRQADLSVIHMASLVQPSQRVLAQNKIFHYSRSHSLCPPHKGVRNLSHVGKAVPW